MNVKFNKNAKVDKFTNMLGIAVFLIVKDPFIFRCGRKFENSWTENQQFSGTVILKVIATRPFSLIQNQEIFVYVGT